MSGSPKLNFKFHKGVDIYSDGDVEQDILDYIDRFEPEDYGRVLSADSRWPVFYHLNSIRKNVLNWYPFKTDSSVLEVGAGMGAVTGALCDKCAHVTAVELSERRARAIEKRCRNKDNLEIIVANFNDIEFDKKFDYITLIGVLEYAAMYTKTETPFTDFLNKLKSLLKPDGKLLIAIENKFGMKYFAGAAEDHTSMLYDGLTGYIHSGSPVRTFGHDGLQRLMESVGLVHNKFYYPLPDYKFPNVIFTDAFLPDIENIHRNLAYYNVEYINFEETPVYNEVIKDNPEQFKFFANSFILEAGLRDDLANIDFVSFNNYRKEKYMLCTKIANRSVFKSPLTATAVGHFDNVKNNIVLLESLGFRTLDSFDGEKINSKFSDSEHLLECILADTCEKGGFDAVIERAEQFFGHILEKSHPGDAGESVYKKYDIELTGDEQKRLDRMTYVKYGFWDMLFKNCFYMDGEYFFYDQEWLEYNVPMEHIIYRNIVHSSFDEVKRKMLYEHFNVGDIDIFEKLDDVLAVQVPHSEDDTFLRGRRRISHVLEERTNRLEALEISEKECRRLSDSLQTTVDDQNSRLAALQEERRVLSESYALMTVNYNQVTNSFWWKLSKPARLMSKGLKSFCKAVPGVRSLYRVLFYLRNLGFKATVKKVKHKFSKEKLKSAVNLPSSAQLKAESEVVFDKAVKISVVVPLYNTPLEFLDEMIQSVVNQSYKNWELCLADGSDGGDSVEKACEKYAKNDKRIKYKKLSENEGISENTNRAIEMATGDYIALFDHDDLLHPSAFFEYVTAVCEKNADFIYCDELTFEGSMKNVVSVHYKPDWSPDNLRAQNYITHLSVFSRELLDEAGMLRKEFDGSQDHDLILRLTEKAESIVHIPKVLYFWRSHSASVAGGIDAKSYAVTAGINAVKSHMERVGLKGEVSSSKLFPAIYRIQYEIKGNPLVSIVIPNKDHAGDLTKCINSILRRSTYKNFEIIVVENNSTEEETFKYYKILGTYDNIKVVTYQSDGAFNYSKINNFGVEHAAGEHLLLLNNDIEVITENWIEEMLMLSQRDDVGAVGAMLYYPNDTIQHAGVILGIGGVAGHSHKYFNRYNETGYFGRNLYQQNFSAVTAACMMMKKSVFDEIEGFNEEFSVAFNDIDLCMRIRRRGYLILWTPYAELYHYESISRGHEDTPEKVARFNKEIGLFKSYWEEELKKGDPCYNRNLTLEREDFSPMDDDEKARRDTSFSS